MDGYVEKWDSFCMIIVSVSNGLLVMYYLL